MSTKNVDARMSMFGRLAMESGLVVYEDIVSCVEEQEKYRADGLAAPKLGELLVDRGILTEEEVELILKMQANPAGLIGRQLVENGLVTREQLREALDEQAEYVHSGLPAPRIGEMLVEKGVIKSSDLAILLKKKGTPGNLFGEFLVANNIVSQADIDRCLLMQKQTSESGRSPARLGELLVKCGLLRKEQMELYSQRHAMARRQGAPALVSGPVRRTGNRRAVGDYEVLETLGQHVDGGSFKAVHAGSGAVVVMHHFNTADTVVVFPVRRGEENKETDTLFETPFGSKVRKAMALRGTGTQLLLSDDTINGHRAIIADYIDGATLACVIADEGKIAWAWAAEILHDLAGLLAEAEKIGLSHDDIRPGAILVDAAGKARLGLWAYTRHPVENRDWLAKKHHPLSYYFAPERLVGEPGPKADMFALGLTIIHALTGRPSLRGDNAEEAAAQYSPGTVMQDLALDMDLPMEFLTIISSLVEADPANRPASFAALHASTRDLVRAEGLELGHINLPFAREMAPDQADQVINKFLSAATAVVAGKKVGIRQMVGYFAAPLLAMTLLMLAVTVVYKTTQSSHGLMVRANWLDIQGDKAGSLTLYRMISVIYPKNETVQQRYFDLAMEVRDHGEAEIALGRLADLRPERKEEYRELQGDLLVWQKRFASAAEIYRELLDRRPNDLALRGKLASSLLWAHNYDGAMAEYRRLAALEPGDSSVMLGLGRSAAGAKNNDEAMRVFGSLLRANQLPENTLMEYGWILDQEGRQSELGDLARVTLARSESVDYSRRNLVTLNYWAGDYAKARDLMDGMSGQGDNDRESILFRVGLNDKLGNFGEVIRDYNRLADMEPANTEYLLTIARLYQGKDDFDKAAANFQAALKRDEGNLEIRREIAANYGYINDLDNAVRWYGDILNRHPNDKQAIDGLVQALLWNEQYEEARNYVERIYRDNPSDRNARVNYALVYSRLGREQEIMPLVDELLRNNLLTEEERERLALNAMSSNSNQLLLRIIGDTAISTGRVTELRLLLARRLRAQSRHATALPLYAAVLAATPRPEPGLLMEMAETANWAKRPDIATRWLELARDIVAEREGRSAPEATEQRFLLTNKDWETLLEPLRSQPRILDSLSGFQQEFSRDGAIRK